MQKGKLLKFTTMNATIKGATVKATGRNSAIFTLFTDSNEHEVLSAICDRLNESLARSGIRNEVQYYTLSQTERKSPCIDIYVEFPEVREWFICGYGSDCDGHNSGHITAFLSEEVAQRACNRMNEGSDGIFYRIVERNAALEYCDSFLRSLPSFYCDELYGEE